MSRTDILPGELYVARSDSHWSNRNKRSWTPQEVEEFIKSNCEGADPMRPVGKQILLRDVSKDEVTAGGIIIPQYTLDDMNRDCNVALILDFGPDAYQDLELFPTGPYCRRGDFVFYHIYERRRALHKINGKDVKVFITYDDKVLGLIEDTKTIQSTLRG